MAILHRDRPETATDDTVAGPGAAPRPAWPQHTLATDAEPVVIRKNSFARTLATILATVILVAVVAVAAANTERVDIDLLYDTVDAELWALVAGSAGAGFVIGALLGFAGRRRKTARI